MSEPSFRSLQILVMVSGILVAAGGWVWAASDKSSILARHTEMLTDQEHRLREVEAARQRMDGKLDAIIDSLHRIEGKTP